MRQLLLASCIALATVSGCASGGGVSPSPDIAAVLASSSRSAEDRERDARDKPKILFNYLSHPDDLAEFRAGTRFAREIFAQKAFDAYRGREIQPGKDVQTDDEIDAFVRAKVESAYHPSCSCKMGRSSDPMAVVDPEGRVYGVEALRVIDSSVMPSITTGNLNAPTIMVAEKMADHVLGRAPLAPSTAPYYVVGNWQVSQR